MSNLIVHNLHGPEDLCSGHDRPTVIQGFVIAYLVDNEGRDVFQRDIESEFRVRRSTVTGILQLMEKSGLIVRTPVAHDARLKKLELTEKARKLNEHVNRQIDLMERKMTRGISEQELEAFYAVTGKIMKNLEKGAEISNSPTRNCGGTE